MNRILRLPVRLLQENPGLRGGIMRVGSATVLAQLAALAAMPVLSRVYDEEAFGRFGLLFTYITTAGAVVPLSLHEALLAARRRSDAINLLAAAFCSTTLMSLLVALLGYAFIRRDLFGLGALPAWSAVLIAPSVWLIGVAMVLQLWAIRSRRFSHLAGASLTQGLARIAVQVVAGLAPSLGWFGLFAGELVGRLAAVVMMGQPAAGVMRAAATRVRGPAWRVFVRFRRFPLWRTPSHLANNLASATPLFLIASAFPAEDVGQLSLMTTIVAAPIGFVLRVVGDVFLGEFTASFHRAPEEAHNLLKRTLFALFALAAIPCLFLLLFGRPVFALAFGTQWSEAGRMASLYAPLLAANLIVAPLGGALNVVGRTADKLMVDLAALALQAAAFGLALAMQRDAAVTAGFIFSGYSLAYVLYLGLILRAVSASRASVV